MGTFKVPVRVQNVVLRKKSAELPSVLVDTGTTLLGLVEHLTGVERYWFGYHLAGAGSDTDGDPATDVAADGSTESVLQAYRDAIADSDLAIERAGDPNTRRPTSRRRASDSAMGARPHDQRDCTACRTCRHPEGADRRNDGALGRPRDPPAL